MSTIWIIAKGTFGEAMRRRILNVFLFVALALIIMAFAFSSFEPRQELVLIKGLGLSVILLAGVFISVILSINLLPIEIERRTIYSILSKPVQRYEFLCGKFLGGLLTVLANVGLMALAFIALLTIKEHSLDTSVIKGIVMNAFQLLMVCALGVTFSVMMTPFVNFFLTFSIYFLGSISTVWASLATDDGKHSLLTVYFFKFVHLTLPNFDNFNVQNSIIHPDVHITNEQVYIAQCIGYAIAYSAALLLVATFVFDRREV